MNTHPDYVIVIPARFESRRLPGKPLVDICGQTLIERVWRCAMASGAGEVVIATDDERIAAAAGAFGATVRMTATGHSCGSDRITECANQMGWVDDRIIVNLQGDEPLMPPECLDQAASLLERDRQADAATLYWPIQDPREVSDPNAVKVVVGEGGNALYFSRAAVPFARDFASVSMAMNAGVRWHRHLGLYAYRKGSLDRFSRAQPTALEQAERLEQLRFLETGGRIAIARACRAIPGGVDTAEDLEKVRNTILQIT
jgi:3-deoxy-manno-octulosonate cytidylyltransferase (CMP-KDO synthetase)